MATDKEPAVSESKRRVFDVAEQLFMEQGYRNVTLRDIAGRLDIRQASLYYHFPEGKEQLYVEMAMRVFDRHRQGIQAAIEAAGPDLAAQLRAIDGWFSSQPRMNLSSMMHSDMPPLSEQSEAQLRACVYECMFAPISGVFRQAMARGEIRDVDPNLLTGTFLAIMDSVEFAGQGPNTLSRQELIESVISVLLYGIYKQEPAHGATALDEPQ